MSIRAHRLVAAGALAVAAIGAPLAIAMTSQAGQAGQSEAGPRCLSWYGNKEDGVCLGHSNGNGATVGSPGVGFDSGGLGITTGPLLPGHTWTTPLG